MGSKNTANGEFALTANTIGMNNTAIVSGSLSKNTMGNGNTAVGSQALESNTTGSRNTASGIGALEEDTVGNLNTANGYNALYYSSGSNNIGLGANGGVYLTTGSNNIDIGNGGLPSDTGKIRIGTQGVQTGTSITGIYNVAVTGSAVVVNSTGKLDVPPSSARFKGEIKPMDKVSEAILALEPVTFHYKKEIDPESIPQFGLVAEEVEKADPDLVVRDSEGKIYSVRYDAVNAMLLNEFLKEHGKVQALEATITQLKSMVEKQQAANAQQQKQIEGLTTDLQKVSAQLEANKPAPAVVNNP